MTDLCLFFNVCSCFLIKHLIFCFKYKHQTGSHYTVIRSLYSDPFIIQWSVHYTVIAEPTYNWALCLSNVVIVCNLFFLDMSYVLFIWHDVSTYCVNVSPIEGAWHWVCVKSDHGNCPLDTYQRETDKHFLFHHTFPENVRLKTKLII